MMTLGRTIVGVRCEEEPSADTFVCLGQRLREAARHEGFALLPLTL